jgi:hypothetical protein
MFLNAMNNYECIYIKCIWNSACEINTGGYKHPGGGGGCSLVFGQKRYMAFVALLYGSHVIWRDCGVSV